MAKAISGGVVTRRQAITAATAAAIIPTTAIAETIDPHHAWLEEWRVLRQIYNDMPDDECDEGNRLFDELWRLVDLIVDTPATTAQGIGAKQALVHENCANITTLGGSGDVVSSIANQTIAFLERLA